MNNELRDAIFVVAHELRYSEDRCETAFWLLNEYADILTEDQGIEFLNKIKIELEETRASER